MIYGGGLTLGYDAENRLVTAGSVSYTYDLLGRRISRTYGGSTTIYVWDGAHIIAEYTNGSLTKKYIYGPGMDNPVVMINVSGQNEAWYYYGVYPGPDPGPMHWAVFGCCLMRAGLSWKAMPMIHTASRL